MRVAIRTTTADDTRAVGEALAPILRARDAVALTGELGAGKTTLAQGIARGLGVSDPVVSPTFTLIREYRGRELDIAHVDVYRLDRMQDVVDLGLDELGDGEALLLVEWGDAVDALLPPGHLTIELTSDADDVRTLVVAAAGDAWAERWPALAEALAPWAGP